MQKLVRGLAAVTALTAALLVIAGGASATTSWTATKTLAVHLAGTPAGMLASSTPLSVDVALRLRNTSGLDNAIAQGVKLTPAQFKAGYAASDASVASVEAYLTQQGFTNVGATANNLFVTGDGTAAAASRAFNTTLSKWTVNGKTLYANSTAAQVPSSLNGTVLSVLGLNDAVGMHGDATIGIPNYLVSYDPQGFWAAYDAGSTPTGSASQIAIFGSGDMSGVVSDLRTEEAATGLPQVPVSVVYSGAKTAADGADEWDMDTQFSTGMAGGVSQLDIYSASSLSDDDLTLTFNRFVTDDTAQAGSASFGECEAFPALDGSMAAWDQIFQEAAAQGQTVFASAGDTGGFCPVGTAVNGVPAGAPDVNYPASSPWVVSAGGTTLLTNSDGSYDSETAWLAGGGGQSLFEPQQSWQGAVFSDPIGKAVPDVAMDADPDSGANVYVDGAPEGVGGTSLSSPLTLGVWARLESAHANGLGFAGPVLYAQSGSAGFHDIILGDTGPYPATPGYDLATGLGTFDVSAMNNLVGG